MSASDRLPQEKYDAAIERLEADRAYAESMEKAGVPMPDPLAVAQTTVLAATEAALERGITLAQQAALDKWANEVRRMERQSDPHARAMTAGLTATEKALAVGVTPAQQAVLEKWAAIAEERAAILEFIDWAEGDGLVYCRWSYGRGDILDRFYGINRRDLEDARRALLAGTREAPR